MKGDEMDELIQGLVAVLERGIVVEPYGDNWTTRTGAVRIRLADEQPDPNEAEGNGQSITNW